MMHKITIISCLLISCIFPSNGLKEEHPNTATPNQDANDNFMTMTTTTTTTIQPASPSNYIFQGCRLYLAPTTTSLHDNNSSIGNHPWGVFTAVPLKRGQPVAPPDIILQLHDYYEDTATTTTTSTSTTATTTTTNNNNKNPLKLLIEDYTWDSQRTGGNHEATKVASLLPGIGSLAYGQTNKKYSNTLLYRPEVDEANVPRTKKAGAGAFTHYHNLTFFASKDLEVGSEIFTYYGHDDWFQPRIQKYQQKEMQNDGSLSSSSSSTTITTNNNDTPIKYQRSIEWLQQNGYCLENLKPGQSTIKGAARGAFASRRLPKGTTISPLPLVPISNRDALLVPMDAKGRKSKKNKQLLSLQDHHNVKPQLLLNYCYGHIKSSLLFYPLSPIVNLINHASDSTKINAEIKWSSSSSLYSTTGSKAWEMTLDEVKGMDSTTAGLMMEVIATKDIQQGEEIFIDYGKEWQKSWERHSEIWQSPKGAESYSPAYVMDDAAALLRTEKEQKEYPYPSNVETSCFYNISIAKQQNEDIGTSKGTTTIKWEMDRTTFDLRNRRPCSVVQREKLPNGHIWYTVLLKNRPALAPEQRIPKGKLLILNHVPRQAIRFTDRAYTTDQHLPNAFRHEIQLPDSVFPEIWKDLD